MADVNQGTQPHSPSPRTARPRIPAAIWTLGFVSMLMDIASEMIHSLLPVFMVTVLGASAFAVGLIEGAAEATALVVKVFSGALSDWLGRRKPIAVTGYLLGALSKPAFALAPGVGTVLAARLVDRVGKGIRGAPRDALVADIAPEGVRGAAFGLRQALDTVGAFLGPVLAIALMAAWHDSFRAVFWVAVIPGFLAVALLAFGVDEPAAAPVRKGNGHPLRLASLRTLPAGYWWVVSIGAVFTLARFSEAFLVLRAQQTGLSLTWTPLVLIVMNVVYSAGAFPFGMLADVTSHARLLALGLVVLVVADVALAQPSAVAVWTGIALWGLHMAMTQGLLATMVADTAPDALRGTAFGVFNLASGLAMLVASALAGLLWDRLGSAATFHAGAIFAAVAALALAPRALRGQDRARG